MQVHELKPVAPGSGFFIVQRVKSPAAEWAVQEDFASINLKVIDEASPTPPVWSGALTVADVVFDELQVDGFWENPDGSLIDALGYNVRYPTLASQTPAAGRYYLFKFQYVPASGQPFYEFFRVKTLGQAY